MRWLRDLTWGLSLAAASFLVLAALVFGPPVGAVLPGFAALLLVAGLASWSLRSGSTHAELARAILWDFLVDIAVPILLVVSVPLVLLALVTDLDFRLWQALIAGVFIATGWLTTAIFAEGERRRLKAEKLRDYHKAIYAEIRQSVGVFWAEGRARLEAARMIRRIRNEPGFAPLIPRERHDQVFAAILSDIEIFPRQTIDLIVDYYSHVGAMGALAEDMRSDRFLSADFGPRRRARTYLDFFRTRERSYELGLACLSVIKSYADGGAAAADAALDALNNPGAGPSVPQRGQM